ncbi:MAG: hypothetical protein VX112_04160 [Pseudomonadota bacterium]|nr:hypothetical protein [Pseudomonadota bacterium]
MVNYGTTVGGVVAAAVMLWCVQYFFICGVMAVIMLAVHARRL